MDKFKLVLFLLFVLLFGNLSAASYSDGSWDYKLPDEIGNLFKTPENLTTWIFEDGTFVPMAKLQGGKSYSIITDHLGTPTEAYDEEGKKVWSRELGIYGQTRNETGTTNFVPYLYQGQYLDVETELAYNRFRYYSPESGGYISQDPIRLSGGMPNMYSYVSEANSKLDPLGLADIWYRALNSNDMSSLDAGGDITAKTLMQINQWLITLILVHKTGMKEINIFQ